MRKPSRASTSSNAAASETATSNAATPELITPHAATSDRTASRPSSLGRVDAADAGDQPVGVDRASSCWSRFCGAVRRLAFVAAALSAAGLFGWSHLQTRLDDEVRLALEQALLEPLAGSPLRVDVRSARRVMGEAETDRGIEARGIEVVDSRTGEPLLRIDELWLGCQCDLPALLNREIVVRHVAMRRPRLSLYGAIEDWGEWKRFLSRRPPTGKPWPTVVVEDGVVEWVRDSERRQVVTIRGLDVTVAPPSAELLRAHGFSDSPEANHASGKLVHARLSGAGELVDELRLDLVYDRKTNAWSARGETRGLRVAREFLGLVPSRWKFPELSWETLEARGELTVNARSSTPGAPPTFNIAGQFHQGRWAEPSWPAPFSDLELDFTANAEGVEVKRLSGRSGAAEFELAGRRLGWEPNARVDALIQLRRFVLTRAWIELAPAALRASWSRFGVLGEFDGRLTVAYDGVRWRPEGRVDGRNLSASAYFFPYPLADGRGSLQVDGDRLRTSDTAFRVQGRPIEVAFDIRRPGPDFTGYATVRAPEGVPIDETLLGSLEGRTATFFRSLQPRGEMLVEGRVERRAAGEPLKRWVEIQLRRAAIQYAVFPYPVERIEGKIRMEDNVWRIGELTGRNDSAYVVARGEWIARPQGGSLRMEVEAYDVALEEELRTALTPGVQKVWSELQPRGTIDYMAIGLRYPRENGQLGIDLMLQKNPPSKNIEGRNVTLRPQRFPYPLDNVIGNLRYIDGTLEIESLRAEHARTTFQARAQGRVESDGAWTIRFQDLVADRLQLDHDLLSALPGPAAAAIAKMEWSGPINVDGTITARGGAASHSSASPPATPPSSVSAPSTSALPASVSQMPLGVEWDVRVDVENGRMKLATPIEQIRGAARLVGGWSDSAWNSELELAVDSAFIQGVHVTKIAGPVYLSSDALIAGDTWARQRRGQTLNVAEGAKANANAGMKAPRQLTARVCGGQVGADAFVKFNAETAFRFQAGAQNVSMRELARELAAKTQDLQGSVFATLQLEGTARGPHTWRGLGKVTCRDTDLQQLPVMGAVLRPNGKRSEGPALALSDIDFSVQGDRVYFDRIDLKGDRLTLKGHGEMTLERIVDLQFYTLVGREDFWVPVVSPVIAEASRQMLEIHVKGPLENPAIERKAVPAINDALRQMFPELANRDDTPPLINRLPTPRQLFQGRMR